MNKLHLHKRALAPFEGERLFSWHGWTEIRGEVTGGTTSWSMSFASMMVSLRLIIILILGWARDSLTATGAAFLLWADVYLFFLARGVQRAPAKTWGAPGVLKNKAPRVRKQQAKWLLPGENNWKRSLTLQICGLSDRVLDPVNF